MFLPRPHIVKGWYRRLYAKLVHKHNRTVGIGGIGRGVEVGSWGCTHTLFEKQTIEARSSVDS